MRVWPALVFASAAFAAGLALAQSRTDVNEFQPPRAAGSRAEASQVGGPSSRRTLPQLSTPERGAPQPSQLSSGRRETASGQLTNERRAAPPLSQLAKGRTAEAPTALSTPAQGRTAATEVLKGADRCDPRTDIRLTPTQRARCGRVIERRSAEFARPAPRELSPEEHLLLFPDDGLTEDARTAARNLANGQVGGSEGAQAVAAAANHPWGRDAADPGERAQVRSEINAIVQGGGVSVR